LSPTEQNRADQRLIVFTLKMESAWTSETSVSYQLTTRSYDLEHYDKTRATRKVRNKNFIRNSLLEYKPFSVHMTLLRYAIHRICLQKNISVTDGRELGRPSTEMCGIF